MKKLTNEEKNILYKEFIRYFMKTNTTCSYNTFARMSDRLAIRSSKEALEFAKENMDEEEYIQFYRKIDPFTPLNEDEAEEKEELKKKVIDIANKVKEGKANLIDIIDNFDISLETYMQWLSILAYQTKEISVSTMNSNRQLYDVTYNYKKSDKRTFTINITKQDDELICSMITSRNLKVNDTTYFQMYNYAKRNGIIKNKKLA